MNLPPIPLRLADVPRVVAQWKRQLEQADAQNRKTTSDVELANGARVIVTSPNGTRYAVQVSDAGVLFTVAL